MKHTFAFIFACTLAISSFSQKNKDLALFVSVSEYKYLTNLGYSDNIASLQKIFRPDRFNTTCINNKQANKETILKVLSSLIAQTQKGSKVVVYFAGHGVQMSDVSGDEIDGYDEAFVPYNAPKRPTNRDCIIDDEFGSKIDSIRQISGPTGHVFVMIDACHSATMLRGDAKTDRIKNLYSEPYNVDIDKASYVCLSSVRSSEKYTFSGNVSPLVRYFSEYVIDLKNTQNKIPFSYKELYHLIATKFHARNKTYRPIIEGDIDFEFMGEKDLGSEILYRVIETSKLKQQGKLTINVGSLMGVFPKSSVQLINIKGNKILANGIVDESTPDKSEVLLDRVIKVRDAIQAKVIVNNRSYSALKLKLKFDNTCPLISQYLKNNLDFIEIVESAPDVVMVKEASLIKFKSVISQRTILKIPASKLNRTPAKFKIRNRLKEHAYANFVKHLTVQAGKPMGVSIGLCYKSGENILSHTNELTTTTQDTLNIIVKNDSEETKYYGIITLDNDDTISVSFPFEGKSKRVLAHDLEIGPNKKITLSDFPIRFNKVEDLLVICISSDTPLTYLDKVFLSGSRAQVKASDNPFVALLGKMIFDTRGEYSAPPSGQIQFSAVNVRVTAK